MSLLANPLLSSEHTWKHRKIYFCPIYMLYTPIKILINSLKKTAWKNTTFMARNLPDRIFQYDLL